MKETDLRLMNYYKREERERILAEGEKFLTWITEGSSEERYARIKLKEFMRNIEFGRTL